MKRIKQHSTFFFLLGTLLISSPALISCQNESTEMTSEEKETAKKEISALENKLLRDSEKMDIEAALKPYLNTADFISIQQDGTFCNYNAMKSHYIENSKRIAGYKATTIKEEYRFLNKNEVLYTWFGKVEATLKTGEKHKTDAYASSAIFSKINNVWKIVYEHSSMAPPIKIGATK